MSINPKLQSLGDAYAEACVQSLNHGVKANELQMEVDTLLEALDALLKRIYGYGPELQATTAVRGAKWLLRHTAIGLLREAEGENEL